MSWSIGSVISRRNRSGRTLRRAVLACPALVALAGFANSAHASNLYWDANGTTLGAGAAPVGTWGVDSFWNDQADGGPAGTIGAFVDGSTAVFSAGNDATGAYTVTVSGAPTVNGISVEEGTLALSGGTINLSNAGSTGFAVAPSLTTTVTSVLAGSDRLVKTGTGTLKLGTSQTQANTFTGGLTIQGGVVEIGGENNAAAGAANPIGAVPGGTVADYLILDGGTLRTTKNDNSGSASVLVAARGITVTANGGGIELTAATSLLNEDGVINNSSGGVFTKSGPGNMRLRANMIGSSTSAVNITGGTVTIDSSLRFGTQAKITLNGGTIVQTNPLNAGGFVSVNSILEIGANGGTVDYSSSNPSVGLVTTYTPTATTGIMGVGGTTTNGGAGTLTKTGAGEFRYQGPGLPNTSYAKLVVKQGLFRLGFNGGIQDERGFGAVPTSFVPDQITLDGGSIGTSFVSSFNVLNANRGITLGAGGGTLLGTSFTIPGAITGPGDLAITTNNGINILQGVNTYTGRTIVTLNGTVAVTADSGLGAAPASPVANRLTLGGATSGGILRADGSMTLATNRGIFLDVGGGTINTSTNSVTYGGSITGSGAFTKTGSGTLQLDGSSGYTGATNVNAGTVLLNNSLTTSASFTAADTTVTRIGSTPTGTRMLKTGAITLNGSAKLDLTTNKVVTSNLPGTWNGTNYDGVTGLVAAGRNGGGWGGNGIITSASAAATGNLTTIGVATGAQVKGIAATATATFAGQTVSGTDTLVMYTYGGDANLDGKINVDDYTRIDFNVPLGTNGWYNGDFNYDGKINVDDYTIIDFNVGIQGAPFFTAGGAGSGGLSGVTAVPEPATMSVLTLAAGGLLARRRRGRQS